MLTLLINVENILTDYIPRSIFFFQSKANLIDKKLPEEFIDNYLSASDDLLAQHFYRFPHFEQFKKESNQLIETINTQIDASNPRLKALKEFKKHYPIQIGLIYDQKQASARHISKYLEQELEPIVQLYRDDAFIGKPEANIFLKAKALAKLKVKETYVLDASKNGILSAYLANMRGIYLDQGAGMSERTFKYSFRQVHTFEEVKMLLIEHLNGSLK